MQRTTRGHFGNQRSFFTKATDAWVPCAADVTKTCFVRNAFHDMKRRLLVLYIIPEEPVALIMQQERAAICPSQRHQSVANLARLPLVTIKHQDLGRWRQVIARLRQDIAFCQSNGQDLAAALDHGAPRGATRRNGWLELRILKYNDV